MALALGIGMDKMFDTFFAAQAYAGGLSVKDTLTNLAGEAHIASSREPPPTQRIALRVIQRVP